MDAIGLILGRLILEYYLEHRLCKKYLFEYHKNYDYNFNNIRISFLKIFLSALPFCKILCEIYVKRGKFQTGELIFVKKTSYEGMQHHLVCTTEIYTIF